MPIKIDPASISIDFKGKVQVSDEKLAQQIADYSASNSIIDTTNSGTCNGNNLVCTNDGDCSGSDNMSKCTNSSVCHTRFPPGGGN